MQTHKFDEFSSGDHLVICDRCGKKFWRSETQFEWNGLLTCKKECWEPRNTQDFVTTPRDSQTTGKTKVETPAE